MPTGKAMEKYITLANNFLLQLSGPIPMGFDNNLFEILINENDQEEMKSKPTSEKIKMDIRNHLKKYMKDYIAYAFWIILLFMLVLTLGTIATSHKANI